MFMKSLLKMSLAVAFVVVAGLSAVAQAPPRDVLASFPESQALLYVNARRIFDEALPRVVPRQQLDKMYAEVQQKTTFDVRGIHFVALGVRFQEPFSVKTPPDFVVMVKGTFNADALLSLARMAAGEGLTQETYRGRTISVLKLKKDAPPAGAAAADGQTQAQPQKPQAPPFPIPEVAFVSLDQNTVVAGVPGYVRAAVDAANGEGRLRADLLDLVTRNPDNLVSLAGDIPAGLADLAKSMGAPNNPEVARVLGSLKQLQTSVTMGANDFGAQTIIRTDTPESAQLINGFVTMGLSFGRTALEGELKKVPANKPRERELMQTVLNVLSTLRHGATGNEVQLNASLPQAAVADMVRKQFTAQAAAAQAKKTTPRATRRRGATRRRR